MKSSNKINLRSSKIQGLKTVSSRSSDEPRYKVSSESIPEEYRLRLSNGEWMDSRDPILFYMEKAKQLLAMSH